MCNPLSPLPICCCKDCPASTATGAASSANVGVSQKPDVKNTHVQILCADPDGKVVEVSHLAASGTIAHVNLKFQSKLDRLGAVTLLVDQKSGQKSLRASCSVHSKCVCWISNARNADLLFDWLAEGRRNSKDNHLNLAIELKRSIGMKVKK